MSEIWIVEGSSGEYSDHSDWPIKAFRVKTAAERLVVEAQARANEIEQNKQSMDWSDWCDLQDQQPPDPRTVNEFDPDMEMSYNGVHYTCYAIELVEEP